MKDDNAEHGCGGGLVRDGENVSTVAATKPANGLPKLDAEDAVYDVFLTYLRAGQPDPTGKPIKLTAELKEEFPGLNAPIRDKAWSTYTLEQQVAAQAESTGESNDAA